MFKSLFDGLLAASGAALFSVLPSFIQQYLSGLSAVQGYLVRQAPAPGVGGRVSFADEAFRQWLDAAVHDIGNSSGLGRLFAFIRNFDPDIARDTLRTFEPGVQFTTDGLYFFILGILAGLLISNLIVGLLRLMLGRRKRKDWYA
jgi:hypothetical protein